MKLLGANKLAFPLLAIASSALAQPQSVFLDQLFATTRPVGGIRVIQVRDDQDLVVRDVANPLILNGDSLYISASKIRLEGKTQIRAFPIDSSPPPQPTAAGLPATPGAAGRAGGSTGDKGATGSVGFAGPNGVAGRSAGTVRIEADSISGVGTLIVISQGQKGGNGGNGGRGGTGGQGGPGASASTELTGCKSSGGDSGPSGDGGTGGPGGAGGPGGSGGTIHLSCAAVTAHGLGRIAIDTSGGIAGVAAAAGAGGSPGQVRPGASGSGPCKGGNAGPAGSAGPTGRAGAPGTVGAAGRVQTPMNCGS